MRTTITIPDSLIDKAKTYSGLTKVSDIVDLAMTTYIALQASTRLAALGGSDPFAEAPPRRRPEAIPAQMLAESPSNFNAPTDSDS